MTDCDYAILNGKNVALMGNETPMSLMKRLGFDTSKIAVEINGEICPRAEYASIVLRKGDVIEVVSFVGGG